MSNLWPTNLVTLWRKTHSEHLVRFRTPGYRIIVIHNLWTTPNHFTIPPSTMVVQVLILGVVVVVAISVRYFNNWFLVQNFVHQTPLSWKKYVLNPKTIWIFFHWTLRSIVRLVRDINMNMGYVIICWGMRYLQTYANESATKFYFIKYLHQCLMNMWLR